jgi:polyisoprenoid-binding protein YceI
MDLRSEALHRIGMHSKLLLASSLVFALAACNNDPAKGKAQASVAEPVAPAAVAASGVKYAFDQSASKVEFVGAKITGKHEGSFKTFRGTVELVDANPLKSQVSVDIDAASLVADQEKLTGHLKSPDFFDVAKFPKAKFVSTAIKAGGDKGATHTVVGNLELHGVTKSISFPATVKVSGDAVDVDAEFGINRKDFGLVYPGKPDDLIKDEVLIKLQIRAKKAG